ncbi:head GIN domain-containing protein [Flavobacterium sp.]|uniref:head GIN domain-containing protein n=1 Tax=Flavobacterium sp. TaxID=239 RepID=UPI00122B60D1|nr:head GIN domain-containing protein [Flavobacterium sp.]RZJ70131.1 MAG: DUF2807 domain-containing protein [Flavobacterium sp.]
MKKTIIAALLVLSGVASAQTTKQINVSKYDEIAISGPYIVELVAGTEGEITLFGEQQDLDNIVVKCDGEHLVIKPAKHIKWKNKAVRITIPFESLSELALAGSGSITSKARIKADHFEIALSGSGRIALDLDTKELEAALSGSGKIELAGKTSKAEANVSGSGKILAFELQSAVADANVSGSGSCEVTCSDAITARISGSGRIHYKGNPVKEDTKVAGSGSIAKS